ncbi:hypothetical protein BDN70DRAFT_996717 [Pholiota conissans]|uniref:HNH nuclease domain-containing protein n=1 Tax=Pholiota conissans TaxID=109636 RepID=A0A9P5YW75_9AGAR|nr:hypothetical protein BDN70DRAFT_996717 [Pholiota conissans]
MTFTPTLTIPLSSTPDDAFAKLWTYDEFSEPSNETETYAVFEEGVRERDKDTCVVCGFGPGLTPLSQCHIIPEVDKASYSWSDMRDLQYIPRNAKLVRREPRNGITLCLNHAFAFERHLFYIRWIPETDEFVVINHSQISKVCESIHGNVLDIKTATTKKCPYPTAFLWHESRARGFYPTCRDRPVTLKRGEQRGGQWHISLRDSGLGIPGHGVNSGTGSGNTVDILSARIMESSSLGFARWLSDKVILQARTEAEPLINPPEEEDMKE